MYMCIGTTKYNFEMTGTLHMKTNKMLLILMSTLVLWDSGVESHASGGKSFLNKKAAVTFLRTKRHACSQDEGYDCSFEVYCENNIEQCTREEDREIYCSPNTCSSGLTCYLSTPCPCHYITRCINDQCKSKPCRNGGTCTTTTNSYTCACQAGYTGSTCETNINECESDPCQNGGQCVDNVNSYRCNCVPGYEDTNCQTDINECESDPCKNGGQCVDNVNSYTCNCVPGYEGIDCQTETNECESNPCQNGGQCQDLLNRYNCTCASRYLGVHCEKDCRPGPADLLFIIDTSYSTKSVFNKTFSFIDTFLRRLPIGPHDFQVAAITFSKTAELLFDFDDFPDNSSLWNTFHSINLSSLTTYTDKALDLARNVLLDKSSGWRQNATQYVILLYDGMSTNRKDTFVARQKIVYGLSGTTILTIGIGKQVDQIELSGVSSTSKHVFSSINDDALNTILRETSHFDCDDCIENTDTDLLLMFDMSNSHRVTELQSLQNVAEELISYLDINTNKNIKISLIGFAESIKTFLSFSELSNNNHLKFLIQTISPVSQESDLTSALRHARITSFTASNGARSGDTRKIVIIFSNAKWTNHIAAIEEANKLKTQGVTLINIGVDLDTDVDKLIDIASDPYYVYLILDHQTEQLKVLASEAMPTVCNKDIFQIRV